ncbi:MAG: hypothetical protein ABI591_14725 [Kofleriaceae bacterium]
MKSILLLALVACGQPHHGATGGDDDDDGGRGDASSTTGDGAVAIDASTAGPSPIPLVACGSPVEVDLTLPTALAFGSFGTYQPAPWLLTESHARIFYPTTGDMMAAAHGSATTTGWPAALAGSTYAAGQHSASGADVVVFLVGSQPMASIVTTGGFAPAIAIPCTPGDFQGACGVRVAGDGHLWVRSAQHLYEQTAQGFADRGGAPIYPTLFDVDAAGDVWIASESSTGDEVFQIWKLLHGAAGWTKTGSLTHAMLGTAAASIEGGFQWDSVFGAFAPDGSIHLLSSARCIGTGQRNRAQLYVRSRDGVTWEVETLPDLGTLVDGQVTWRDLAAWASDYDNVRFVDESSPTPIDNGDGTYSYPDRQLNAIARCVASDQPAFERIAKVRLPGWTVRGFAGFSAAGVTTFATTLGLTQAYR